MLKDAVRQPKEGKPGASQSKGKKLAQAAEGAEAPPEETPPDPQPPKPSKSKGRKLTQAAEGADVPPEETPPDPQLPKPHTEPAPVETQPGTSQAPTEDPIQAPTQPATVNPDEDEPPAPTKYVKVYRAAGKAWLDSVVKDGEEAYTRLFDKLLELGNPHIDNFKQLRNKYSSVSGTKQAGFTLLYLPCDVRDVWYIHFASCYCTFL